MRNIAFMATKDPRKGDRHKPGQQVRVRSAYIPQLKKLAEVRVTSVPEEVNRAIRELLQREGLWPKPEGSG